MEQPLNQLPGTQSYKAAADLSSKQYYAVRISAEGSVNVGNDTTLAIGILQNEPISGGAADVQCYGISPAVGGGSISAGGPVKVNSSGKLVAASTGNTAIGIARSDCGGDGQQFNVQLLPHVAL